MSWFRKTLGIVAVVALSASLIAAKKDDKPAEAEVKAKDAPKKKGKADAPAEPLEKGKITVPVPVGHDAKMLTIPMRDGDGKLQMRFVMELGRRIDADHLAMTKLLIETFDDTSAREMSIDLPDSMLDMNTRVITTKSGATIKREDFELSGQSLNFNTETKQGQLSGQVRMKIYNRENETNPEPEAKPRDK